jgi:diphthine-ammonia ligase
MALNLAVLYSGGKDSNFALYEVVRRGDDVTCLITLRPADEESMLFHYPNVKLTVLQAESLKLPLLAYDISAGEDELYMMSELVGRAKREYGIEGIVTGGLKSVYQRDRFESVCRLHQIKGINPLWNMNEVVYLRCLMASGFKILITRVAAEGLGPEWLGVELDAARVERLIALATTKGFNASFEGGEGETFVLDMPLFEKQIVVLKSERTWDKGAGTLNIIKATLRDKATHV